MQAVQLFRALGDPTRLKMVERLSSTGSQTITSLSKGLHISRQGARKHLQILAESDLVTLEQVGRNTTVTLDQKTLHSGQEFIAHLESQWQKRLHALKSFVEKN